MHPKKLSLSEQETRILRPSHSQCLKSPGCESNKPPSQTDGLDKAGPGEELKACVLGIVVFLCVFLIFSLYVCVPV